VEQGRLNVRLELQKYHVAYSELTLRTAFISLAFHVNLGTEQVLLDNCMHELAISHPLVKFRDWGNIIQVHI
jgi:hypothetical protein